MKRAFTFSMILLVAFLVVSPNAGYAGTRPYPEGYDPGSPRGLPKGALTGAVSAQAEALPFFDDMESGPGAWSSGGFEHLISNPELISVMNPEINPTLVTLPDAGDLPTAHSGTAAWWYGEDVTGTYIGADFQDSTQYPKNGGTSTAANWGWLLSPLVSLHGVDSARLRFHTWWEIEGVDPNEYDMMSVWASTDTGSTFDLLGVLNPLNDPDADEDIPFSSGGLNQPGVWQEQIFDLTPYVGNDLLILFEFDTIDEAYNGFRGWFIDDVGITGEGGPSPFITEVDPPCGIRGDETIISVRGGNFLNGAIVSLDGTPLVTAVISTNFATALVPSFAPEGTYDVTLTNPDTQSALLPDAFTIDLLCPGSLIKMHYPQWPDTTGWDVAMTVFPEPPPDVLAPIYLADDWQCTGTGPVTEINFWISFFGDMYDDPFTAIDGIWLGIFSDIPADSLAPFSMPGSLMWETFAEPGDFTIKPYGLGDQGWFNPWREEWSPFDHEEIWQIEIQDIPEPFSQTEGEIYWLAIGVQPRPYELFLTADDDEPDLPWPWIGWKTSQNDFNDAAVWWVFPEDLGGAGGAGLGEGDVGAAGVYEWTPMYYPPGGPVNLAFTISGPDLCGSEPLCVTIPDTLVFPGDTVLVPVRVTDTSCLGVVSVELDIGYTDTLAHPVPDTLVYENTLPESFPNPWMNDHNVLPGVPGPNTILFGTATDQDTLSGAGVLLWLKFAIDDSIYCPDSTFVDLERVLFNDGIPAACTPFDGGWLKIRGYSATIATDPDTIYPRNTVTITVNDPDENRDPDAPDTIAVSVTGGGDIDGFLLVETGNSTGVFVGMAATEYDPTAGTPYDGTLGVVAGDTVSACYSDCLDSLGNTVEVCAQTFVIGGEDGTLDASYVVATYPDRDGKPDTVRVLVTDPDEDGSGIGDSVLVQLVDGSVIPADVEDELLVDTVVPFRGRVPTVQGPAGVSGDGVLTLNTLGADLDTITTTYIDTLTAAGGYDTLTVVTYVVNRFGDVSANERVGAFDAHLELDFAVGNTVATLREWLVADVDGDSTMLAFDASLILRYVVRLDDTFPVHTYTVRDPKNHPFLKAVGGEMIAFGDAVRQGDGTYLVPMTLADRSEIVSGTFWLSHAPGMEVLGVTTATGYGDFIVAHNPQSEALRVAFAGAQSSVEGAGEVLWIRVRADEDASLWFGVDDAALNGYRMPMSDAGMFDVAVVEVPEMYALHPNVPNPFNPQTTIRYDVPSEGRVSLVVYNVMGQTVRVLVDGDQVAGRHEVMWDGRDMLGRDVGSGMYLMRMRADGFADSRKMLLLR